MALIPNPNRNKSPAPPAFADLVEPPAEAEETESPPAFADLVEPPPEKKILPDLGKAAKNFPGSFKMGLSDMKDAAAFLASANEKYDHAGGGLRFLIGQMITEMRYEDSEEREAYKKVTAAAKAAGGHALADARKDPAYLEALAEAHAISERVMKEKRPFLHSIGDEIFKKWSTWDRFKIELENDPAGIIGDIAAFLAPPLRGAQIPGVAGKVVRGTGKVLDIMDPDYVAGTVVEGIATGVKAGSEAVKKISPGVRNIAVGHPKVNPDMKAVAISTGIEGEDIPLAAVSENKRIMQQEVNRNTPGSNTRRVRDAAFDASMKARYRLTDGKVMSRVRDSAEDIELKILENDALSNKLLPNLPDGPGRMDALIENIVHGDVLNDASTIADLKKALGDDFELVTDAVMERLISQANRDPKSLLDAIKGFDAKYADDTSKLKDLIGEAKHKQLTDLAEYQARFARFDDMKPSEARQLFDEYLRVIKGFVAIGVGVTEGAVWGAVTQIAQMGGTIAIAKFLDSPAGKRWIYEAGDRDGKLSALSRWAAENDQYLQIGKDGVRLIALPMRQLGRVEPEELQARAMMQ